MRIIHWISFVMSGLLCGWIFGTWLSNDHWTEMQVLKKMWFEIEKMWFEIGLAVLFGIIEALSSEEE